MEILSQIGDTQAKLVSSKKNQISALFTDFIPSQQHSIFARFKGRNPGGSLFDLGREIDLDPNGDFHLLDVPCLDQGDSSQIGAEALFNSDQCFVGFGGFFTSGPSLTISHHQDISDEDRVALVSSMHPLKREGCFLDLYALSRTMILTNLQTVKARRDKKRCQIIVRTGPLVFNDGTSGSFNETAVLKPNLRGYELAVSDGTNSVLSKISWEATAVDNFIKIYNRDWPDPKESDGYSLEGVFAFETVRRQGVTKITGKDPQSPVEFKTYWGGVTMERIDDSLFVTSSIEGTGEASFEPSEGSLSIGLVLPERRAELTVNTG